MFAALKISDRSRVNSIAAQWDVREDCGVKTQRWPSKNSSEVTCVSKEAHHNRWFNLNSRLEGQA